MDDVARNAFTADRTLFDYQRVLGFENLAVPDAPPG